MLSIDLLTINLMCIQTRFLSESMDTALRRVLTITLVNQTEDTL